MVNKVSLPSLTKLEGFTVPGKLTTRLKRLNHSIKHPVSGPLLAKIMGLSLLGFAALADVFIHLALFTGKLMAALVVLPFRCCFRLPKDLELSSSLIHLMKAVESVFQILILPPLCAKNPDSAYQEANRQKILSLKQKESQLRDDLEVLRNSKKGLKISLSPGTELISTENELKTHQKEIENLKIAIEEVNKKEQKKHAELIQALTEDRKKLEAQLSKFKKDISENVETTEHKEFKKKITELENKLTQIDGRITIAEEKNRQVNAELQAKKSFLHNLEQNKIQTQETVDRQKREVENLKNEIERLRVSYEDSNKKITELSSSETRKTSVPNEFQNVKLKPVGKKEPAELPKPSPNLMNAILTRVDRSVPNQAEEVVKLNFILDKELKNLPEKLRLKLTQFFEEKIEPSSLGKFSDHSGPTVILLDTDVEKTSRSLENLKSNIKYRQSENAPVFALEEKHKAQIDILLNLSDELKKARENLKLIQDFCDQAAGHQDIKKLDNFFNYLDAPLDQAFISSNSMEDVQKYRELNDSFFVILEYFQTYINHMKTRKVELEWA